MSWSVEGSHKIGNNHRCLAYHSRPLKSATNRLGSGLACDPCVCDVFYVHCARYVHVELPRSPKGIETDSCASSSSTPFYVSWNPFLFIYVVLVFDALLINSFFRLLTMTQ